MKGRRLHRPERVIGLQAPRFPPMLAQREVAAYSSGSRR